nr:hypothetical protein Iba_chr15cCG5180 [Ipomoea batatas]GMD99824.1 hypothetical protein Iba_chr15eCG7550 [Ipomoea batatas]
MQANYTEDNYGSSSNHSIFQHIAVLVMVLFNSNVKSIGGGKLVKRLPLAL